MKTKSGISLIAVLMFMLAATTASIVVFKWIGTENFSSAARLKRSEAYQASESGLDAVQAWLANKAGDVGEVLYQYQENGKKPIKLTGTNNVLSTDSLLGKVGGSKEQRYDVYLTGADLPATGQKKLEFLSIGIGRNDSKVSQKAIFSVDGLYQMTIQVPPPNVCEMQNCDFDDDFDYAFFGGIDTNTQGRFSSGVINGDFKASGISSNKTLIVTGNMEVLDNGEKNIGCKNGSTTEREGDLYVVGYWKARGFNVCGNAYIGGLLSNENNLLRFRRNLYADGGIESRGFTVDSNVTLGGNLTFGNDNALKINGNFVIEKYTLDTKGKLTTTLKNSIPKIVQSGNPKMEIGGSFWSLDPAFDGTAAPNDYDNFKYLGGTGKNLLIPNIAQCASGVTANLCNNDNSGKRYYQTSPKSAYFSSNATLVAPSTTNKPTGANPLPELASKIVPCKNNTQKKCVPDPLEVPQETKDDWSKRGKLLDSLVKANSARTDLPTACIRLVLDKTKNITGDTEDKGLGAHWGASNNKGENFVLSANKCYAELKKTGGDPKKILFPEVSTEKFLVVSVVNPEQKSLNNAFDGNFIFVFEGNMGNQMELPATTDNSNVFIYLKEGATGNMPLNNSCQSPAKDPCKRNYFIFSEKDIAGSSGTAKINGAIFLAGGAKVTGSLPDAGIEFNSVLYDALKKVGAVSMTAEYAGLLGNANSSNSTTVSSSSGNNITEISDNRYIPVASRLSVKLETKDISTSPEPASSQTVEVKPSILVMPRLILLDTGEVSDFNNHYSYMLMNNKGSIDKKSKSPTCKKANEDSTLITSKKEGIYKCTYPSTDSISEFYVQLSKGEVQVSILTSTTLIKQANGCATVSLTSNKKPKDEFTVNVVVEPGTGSGWNCGGSACAGPYSYTISQGAAGSIQVCPTNNPENNSIVLSLRGENISKTNNRVTINFGSGANGKIRRNNNYGTWRDCPSQYMPTGTWVDVACNGKRTTNPNNEWECELNSFANWSITDPGDACKIPAGAPLNGGFTVRESLNSFEASLEWKKYNLTVSGGTASLASSITGQSNFSCNDCSDTIYHKGNYVVTSTERKGYCINKANSCTPANAEGIVGPGNGESFILNPTANTTITLVTAPAKSISCVLNKTNIKEGQNLSASDLTITPIGGCDPGSNSLVFQADGSQPDISELPSSTNKYTIKAKYNNNVCGDFVTCTNQLTVESNFGCDYVPSFCGGAAISSVLDNTTTAPANEGQCVFISNFGVIQPNLNSTVAINGVENACGSGWDSCPYNTKPTTTKDGGYYVYLKSGRINTYNNNGWKDIVAAAKNSACAASTTPAGSCLTHPLTPYGTVPQDPENTCIKQGSDCYKCKSSHSSSNNCTTDWFWGGTFLGTQWVNDGWLEKIACPASSNYEPWCSISGCKQYGTNVQPPTYGCVRGTAITPTTASVSPKFNYTSANHGNVSANAPKGWNGDTTTFPNHNFPSSPGADRDVYMWQITCDGSVIALGSQNAKDGIHCGSFELASNCATSTATATCNLAKTSVTQGENIGRPTITCSNGATPANAAFTAPGATNAASNWDGNANGNAYYASSGTYSVSVSLNCGSTALNNVSCGSITVASPTCTAPTGDGSGNFTLTSTGTVSVPPPTPSCGNASASSAKFNITLANDGNLSSLPTNWNASTPTNHSFGNPYEGRVVRMYQIKCDGHELNYGTESNKDGITCGTINIKKGATCDQLDLSNSSQNIASGKCYTITKIKTGNGGKDCGKIVFDCTSDYEGSSCNRNCSVNNVSYNCNSSNNRLGTGSSLLNTNLTTSGTNTKTWKIECQYE